jgi:hypothetical protein
MYLPEENTEIFCWIASGIAETKKDQFTSKQIIKAIEQNEGESRKEWMLRVLAFLSQEMLNTAIKFLHDNSLKNQGIIRGVAQ